MYRLLSAVLIQAVFLSSVLACPDNLAVIQDPISEDSNLADIKSVHSCQSSILDIRQNELDGFDFGIVADGAVSLLRTDAEGGVETLTLPSLSSDYEDLYFYGENGILLFSDLQNTILIWNGEELVWDDLSLSANQPEGEITELFVYESSIYISISSGINKGIWSLKESDFEQISTYSDAERPVEYGDLGLVQLEHVSGRTSYQLNWLESDRESRKVTSLDTVIDFQMEYQGDETLTVLHSESGVALEWDGNSFQKVFVEKEESEGESDDGLTVGDDVSPTDDIGQSGGREWELVYAYKGSRLQLPSYTKTLKGCFANNEKIYCHTIDSDERKIRVFKVMDFKFVIDMEMYIDSFYSSEEIEEFVSEDLIKEYKMQHYEVWEQEIIEDGLSQDPQVTYTEEEMTSLLDEKWATEITEQDTNAYVEDHLNEEMLVQKEYEKLDEIEIHDYYAANDSRYVALTYDNATRLVEFRSIGEVEHISDPSGDFSFVPRTLNPNVFYWMSYDGEIVSSVRVEIEGVTEERLSVTSPLDSGDDSDGSSNGEGQEIPRAELSGTLSWFILINILMLLSVRRLGSN